MLEEARGDLPMVRYAAYTLYFLGGLYLLLALLFAVSYSLLGATMLMDTGGPEGGVMIGMGLGFGLFIALVALPMIAAGIGLQRGKKWAWILTVCIGGLFAPSGCMPFGVFLLYAMLNDDVRKPFLD